MIAINGGSFPWRDLPAGPDLAQALARGADAQAEELRLLHDRVTREAIQAQAETGVDRVTDGLVRRSGPLAPIASKLAGLRVGAGRVRYPGRAALEAQPLAETEIAWREPILVEDFLFASGGSPRPVQVVLTGPFSVAHLTEDHAYGDPHSLAMALAAALNQELRALQSAGAAFVQIDEPVLLERKDEFPIFTRVWEVLGRGVSATLTLHLEGGTLEGLYPGIARLKRLGGLSVDAVAGRAGLDLLAGAPVPEPVRLGLGVVDGRQPRVETAEEIVALVRDTRGLPPLERLILGTASDLGGLPVSIAAAKLRALASASRMLAG